MGKQTFDRTKKILAISILVLLVMTSMVAVVGAAPPKGDRAAPGSDEKGLAPGYGGDHGNDGNYGNCRWVCDNWHRQRYCDHGHWMYDHGKRFWRCDHWSWRSVCSHWSWRCFGYGGK